MIKSLLTLTILLVLPATSALADISYTSAGSSYGQNFNSLSTTTGTNITWTNDSTIAGWFSNRTTYRASTGSDTTGSLYSNGSAAASDRALGSIASGGTGTIQNGVRFTNNTGITLTQFTVTYDGEQWRNGGNTTQHSLTFDYVTGAGVTLSSGGYSGVSQLNFNGPIATATAAALDGNAAANRVAGITFNVKDITWLPGQQIMLRWTDLNDTGNDHGLAVDNFNFVAVPEPSSMMVVSLVGLAIAGRFRRGR